MHHLFSLWATDCCLHNKWFWRIWLFVLLQRRNQPIAQSVPHSSSQQQAKSSPHIMPRITWFFGCNLFFCLKIFAIKNFCLTITKRRKKRPTKFMIGLCKNPRDWHALGILIVTFVCLKRYGRRWPKLSFLAGL